MAHPHDNDPDEAAVRLVLDDCPHLEQTVVKLRNDLLYQQDSVAELTRHQVDLEDKIRARDDTIGKLQTVEAGQVPLLRRMHDLQEKVAKHEAENALLHDRTLC